MQPPFGAPRVSSPIEPAPPLRAVLDVPLRFALAPELADSIQKLAESVKKTTPDGDWASHYSGAIAVVEQILRDADGRIEEMQRRALSSEDPNELRLRLSQGPRRDAERTRSEAKAGVLKATKEWVERSKRQMEHVVEQCTLAAQKFVVKEHATASGIEVRVDAAWWSDFTAHVARCCEEWTRTATGGAEGGLERAVGAATASLVSAVAKGRVVNTPATLVSPSIDARIGGEPPSKEADIPSLGTALMAYVRSHIMAVGIFGTVIAVVITFSGMLFGTSGEGHGSSSPNTMLIRGGLILAVLPVSIVFGIKAAKSQRIVLRDKALAAHKQATQAYLKAELEKTLERHRKALERWMTTRSEEWTGSLDRWWEEAVEPRLGELDASAADAIREQKLSAGKLTEEQAGLKAFRNQLAQSLLFDLKKRQRELLEARPPA